LIVCHCRQLTDSQLRREIREGASSLDALERACGAGLECGGCRPELSRLILVSSIRPHRERAIDRLVGAASAACVPAAAAVDAVAEVAEAVGTGC
jgi:bacterioferritin-associated ferredoxin